MYYKKCGRENKKIKRKKINVSLIWVLGANPLGK